MGPYFTLNPSHASRFWMPDVFIDQAKALRSPTYYTKPASLRVYNDSTIRYSSRSEINYDITLLIHCTHGLSLHLLLFIPQIINNLHLTIIKRLILTRINYDVACNMDFHKFPVDEQYCEVKFESFGFSNRQVNGKQDFIADSPSPLLPRSR